MWPQQEAEEGGLTSVGAGLLDSMVCGCASDISDSFSSSSSWMGEDGDLRVLDGVKVSKVNNCSHTQKAHK